MRVLKADLIKARRGKKRTAYKISVDKPLGNYKWEDNIQINLNRMKVLT